MNVVTGAFGYIGRYITQQLLDSGHVVKTITTHPDKFNPFGKAVTAYPYHFDRPDELISTLKGATTLYNTYWIRFEHGGATFDDAVQNTLTLFNCAKQAGIQRIVHISVTNPSLDSSLPYYRGKALQERGLQELGVPCKIIRPTLVFGQEDILVNNIAWLIRKFPVFPIFGRGDYKLQPVYAADLAKIAVEDESRGGNQLLDAVGPEDYTFEQLVRLIGATIKPQVKYIHLPPALGIALGGMIGSVVRDVILTRDELRGLMENKLTSNQSPNGTTRFSDWIEENQTTIGKNYTSELDRHFRWSPRKPDED